MAENSAKRQRSIYMRNYRKVKKLQVQLDAELKVDAELKFDADKHTPCLSSTVENVVAPNDDSENEFVVATQIAENMESTESFTSDDNETAPNSDSSFTDEFDEMTTTFVTSEQQSATREFLRRWAIEMNPTIETVNSLLAHLNLFMPNIPKSAITLKENLTKINVKELCGGHYYYLSIREAINLYIRDYSCVTTIDLVINIDGVQAYHSRKDSFWPILATLNDMGPFIVAIWYGRGKPNDVSVYLQDFISEMNILFSDGYKNVSIKLKAFICDSPARCFLKCICNFNSYYGCERCTVRGVYNRGVRLVDLTSDLRTDDMFRHEQYADHQVNTSPLIELKFPMVSGFVLDHMHLVFLGVVKKMLSNWCTGKHGSSRFSQAVKDDISAQLEVIADFIPSQFQRKSRSLNTLDKWKAVEYRLFLLYVGPVVLKNNISNNEYNLFMMLSVAMQILLSDKYCLDRTKVLYAKDILHIFINDCITIYGDDFVTYNIHCLSHIADDVLNYKTSLNRLGAFQFESYLGHLKKDIRGSKHPVQQLVRRYNETKQLEHKVITKKPKRNRLPIKRDRVFSLGNNKFVIQHRIINQDSVLCKLITSGTDWYTTPLPSTDLEYSFKTTITNCGWDIIDKKQLDKQAIMLPINDGGFIFTPLLHNV